MEIQILYKSVLGVVEGVSGSPAVLHHSPGALATTRLPLDTHQHLFLITMVMMKMMMKNANQNNKNSIPIKTPTRSPKSPILTNIRWISITLSYHNHHHNHQHHQHHHTTKKRSETSLSMVHCPCYRLRLNSFSARAGGPLHPNTVRKTLKNTENLYIIDALA